MLGYKEEVGTGKFKVDPKFDISKSPLSWKRSKRECENVTARRALLFSESKASASAFTYPFSVRIACRNPAQSVLVAPLIW